MFIEIASVEEFRTQNLRQVGCMGVCGNLHSKQLINDFGSRIYEAKTAAGREDFREAVGVYGMTCFVIIFDGFQFVTTVAQFLIRVIFQNDDIVFAAQFCQSFSAFFLSSSLVMSVTAVWALSAS